MDEADLGILETELVAISGHHHVLPDTQNIDRSHGFVNDITTTGVGCLVGIGRDAGFARVVGAACSNIGTALKPVAWSAPGHRSGCSAVAPLIFPLISLHLQLSVMGQSLNVHISM